MFKFLKLGFEIIVGLATIVSCFIAVETLDKVQAIYSVNKEITVLSQLNTLLLKETVYNDTVYRETKDSVYIIRHDTVYVSFPREQVPWESVSLHQTREIENKEDEFRKGKGLNLNMNKNKR